MSRYRLVSVDHRLQMGKFRGVARDPRHGTTYYSAERSCAPLTHARPCLRVYFRTSTGDPRESCTTLFNSILFQPGLVIRPDFVQAFYRAFRFAVFISAFCHSVTVAENYPRDELPFSFWDVNRKFQLGRKNCRRKKQIVGKISSSVHNSFFFFFFFV